MNTIQMVKKVEHNKYQETQKEIFFVIQPLKNSIMFIHHNLIYHQNQSNNIQPKNKNQNYLQVKIKTENFQLEGLKDNKLKVKYKFN